MAEAVLEDGSPGTVAEFETWRARQADRWEFIGGQPCLMAPGSRAHTIIKGNVFRALDRGFGGTSCHVFTDGTQILTEEISAIPDVVVSCAPLDLSTPVVAEPTIIVEVMSPWSEGRHPAQVVQLSQDREPHAVFRRRAGPVRGAGTQPRRRSLA